MKTISLKKNLIISFSITFSTIQNTFYGKTLTSELFLRFSILNLIAHSYEGGIRAQVSHAAPHRVLTSPSHPYAGEQYALSLSHTPRKTRAEQRRLRLQYYLKTRTRTIGSGLKLK